MDLARIDALINDGRLSDAKALVRPLLERKHPREELVKLANLARRAWMPEHAARLLFKIVHPTEKRNVAAAATAEEKTEYATALVMLGGHREALKLLQDIDVREVPEALFARSLAHFSQWNWQATLNQWERLIGSPKATELQKLRGELYHATALTHGAHDFDRSTEICERLLKISSPSKNRVIYKNALLLLGQNFAFLKQTAKAAPYFAELEKLSADEDDSRHLLHTRLWKAISNNDVAELRKAREGFKEQERWEQVRVSDYYEAELTGNSELFIHLYFGTPHAAFRERVAKALGGAENIPSKYDWKLWSGKSAPKVLIDSANGTSNASEAFLKEGHVLQRMLLALSSDFVMPPTVAELHEQLYPGEYFNPNSSPDRVHQCLKRLRKWLESANLPLEVRELHGRYRLFSPEGCAIRVYRSEADIPKTPIRTIHFANDLYKKFGAAEFTSNDAVLKLKQPYTTVKRHLASAVAHGLIIAQSSGRETRYKCRG